MSETIVADRFLSGGRALASSCGLRRKGGSSCFGFLLPFFAFSFSLFLALSLIASSQFRFSLSVQSFILYHKLCSLCFSTHAHTSKRSPPSPILFMDHCARTNWHMYIKSCFFPPSSFVYAGVRCEETGRFLLLGWPVQEVLVPFSLSLSLWLCGDEARSNKKKKRKNCRNFLFPLRSCRRVWSSDGSEVIAPVLALEPKVSKTSLVFFLFSFAFFSFPLYEG